MKDETLSSEFISQVTSSDTSKESTLTNEVIDDNLSSGSQQLISEAFTTPNIDTTLSEKEDSTYKILIIASLITSSLSAVLLLITIIGKCCIKKINPTSQRSNDNFELS